MKTPEPEDRSVAERVLKWVMCCQRRLSIEMLVKAVSLDSNSVVDEEVDTDYILYICSNFIIVDHNKLVHFAHLSVQEYLMNGAKHGYSTVDAHNQTAMDSLLYLLAGNFKNGTDTGKKDELLELTALYWPFHYSFALVNEGKGTPLQALLKKFLVAGEIRNGFTTRFENLTSCFAELAPSRG